MGVPQKWLCLSNRVVCLGQSALSQTVLSSFCFPCEFCYLLFQLQLTGLSNVPFSGSAVSALDVLRKFACGSPSSQPLFSI